MNNVKVNRITNNRLSGNFKPEILAMLNSKGRHHLGSYFQYILKYQKNLIKYAALNNKGQIYGFALLSNDPNSNRRKLLLISAKPGYGTKIMKKIISNGVRDYRSFINLEALNQKKLLEFYRRHGYVDLYKNRNNLHHMEKRLPRMAMSTGKSRILVK
jgi:hypothetical protein